MDGLIWFVKFWKPRFLSLAHPFESRVLFLKPLPSLNVNPENRVTQGTTCRRSGCIGGANEFPVFEKSDKQTLREDATRTLVS